MNTRYVAAVRHVRRDLVQLAADSQRIAAVWYEDLTGWIRHDRIRYDERFVEPGLENSRAGSGNRRVTRSVSRMCRTPFRKRHREKCISRRQVTAKPRHRVHRV